jgi:hypothetical protein
MVKIDATSPAATPTPAARPPKADKAPGPRTTGDSFETGRATGPFETSRSPVASGGGLTPAELKSAERAIGLADGGRSAEPIVEWLRAHPDAAKQDAFMDLLFEFRSAAGEILNCTYMRSLPRNDVQVLADALARAWRSGAVTSAELNEAIAAGGRGATFGEDHIGLAEVVALTGDPELTLAFASRELEVFRSSPDERARANAVAIALASLPPSQLSGYLSANEELVQTLVQAMEGHRRSMNSTDLGLARLLEGAARIEPPTPQTLRLFDGSVDLLGDGGHLPRAAGEFYVKHTAAVLEMYRDDSGSLDLVGQEKLSVLFARTLYSESPFAGQELVGEAMAADLARRGDALEAHATVNPPSIEAQREARLLGGLVGAVEGGFQIAVDELKEHNAAVDGMVDLMFRTSVLLPKTSLPGIGILAGQAKDVALKNLKSWVKDRLHEKPRDASEAIPFHELFGQEIDNPALRSGYDAARADAFMNRAMGLR